LYVGFHWAGLFLVFWCAACKEVFGADTIITNQIGQGVVYRHYHYDSLYNAKEEIYVVDVNLSDPATSMKFPYLTGGATRTVSAHAATVTGAIACVNGQFYTRIGPIAFLKVNGVVITNTQPGVHDEQGLSNDGGGRTNSMGITLRPGAAWASLTISNILTAGPDLIRNGVKFTAYDMNDALVTSRNPRTCAAWTYDNHLLLTVVDGRSTASAGLTLPELRDYLYTNASVLNAFNLDGGGSSTMWVTGKVMNVPSDGTPRAVADAVAIVAPLPAIPAAPASLSLTPGTNFFLAWPLASGAMSYKLKRSTTNGGGYATLGSTTTLGYTDTNLSAGITYYYVVTAVNSVGESTNSAQASATAIPPPPTHLTATPGINRVTLSWDLAGGATGYRIKRGISTIAFVSTNYFTNGGLANDVTYSFTVSATNTSGQSADSSPASATPQCFVPSVPQGLLAVTAGDYIALRWPPVDGAYSYTVSRSTVSGGPYTPLTPWTPTTNFTDIATLPGTVYFYTVSASNVCGMSSNSSEVSAPLVLATPVVTPTGAVFKGWGGVPGRQYYVLSATNLALPLSYWTRLATNVFGASGLFGFTNAVEPSGDHQYYLIQTTQP
jgi:fibronectin type 3 domain-containing protein